MYGYRRVIITNYRKHSRIRYGISIHHAKQRYAPKLINLPQLIFFDLNFSLSKSTKTLGLGVNLRNNSVQNLVFV